MYIGGSQALLVIDRDEADEDVWHRTTMRACIRLHQACIAFHVQMVGPITVHRFVCVLYLFSCFEKEKKRDG